MFTVGGWEVKDRSEREEINATRTHIEKYYQRILGAKQQHNHKLKETKKPEDLENTDTSLEGSKSNAKDH